MIALAAWIAAVVVALIVFAALALGLYGHVRRFTGAVQTAEGEITASLRELRISHPARTRSGIPGMDDGQVG